uniref:Protein krueppel n=1 Tax=Anopheles farauti TaxID=69004 RepID=A0A182Q006_9DIPT
MATGVADAGEKLDPKQASELQYYADNFDHLCRLCLSGEKLVSIYSNVQRRNVYYIRHFVKLALDLLAIKIDKHDALPNFLCERCEKNLNSIATFKQKCDDSLRILQHVRENMIDRTISKSIDDLERSKKRRKNTPNNRVKQKCEDILKKLPQEINVKKSIPKEVNSTPKSTIMEPAEQSSYQKVIELVVLKGSDLQLQDKELVETTPKEDRLEPEEDWNGGSKCSDDEKEIDIVYDNEVPVDREIKTATPSAEREQSKRTRGKTKELTEESKKSLNKEKIVCSVCGAMVNSIKSHMAIHTDRPHQCEQCPKSFTSRTKLQSHINSVHLRKRDFKCDICGKAFLEKNNLKGHMRIHNGERKYACDLCPKTFLFAGTLRCHMLTHTQEKRHECETCGKLFLLRTTLNKHLRVHTGEKPYSCTVCEKSFRTTTHMVVHMRTHTGEKPLSCRICGMGFAHHKARSVHMKTKHPEELVALGLINDKGHLKV